MTEIFELVMIGSGSAVEECGVEVPQGGWTVAMIDERPFGGTCALRGCDPKRVWVDAAAAGRWPSADQPAISRFAPIRNWSSRSLTSEKSAATSAAAPTGARAAKKGRCSCSD
jgi:pyruvate/2-oxoglutarate dehydrogenase complex dihydrolipoamide dehydrogenase (E3) component